ncbi:hypothetical protein IKF23_02180, partial [Candidatus Saccharibacteria bacterium]|nr:hypothetical protein [Candidatus Saccharibacteria bacterium]
IYRAALSLLILCLSFTIVGLLNSSLAFADNLDYNVVVKPSLKLTLSSTNPSLNLNPANHTFDTTSLTATVATNYTNGYKLYLDTTSGSGGTSNTELVNTTNSTYTIPTLASSSTSSSFPANYWGYKLDSASTEYLSYVPNTLISQSATNTNGTSSNIDFAAKIDYEKPAGLYSIAFDLKTIPIVTQVYMQDMTAEQCTETPTIVIDKRDEHPYLVQRLADGKCWMLDNLDLDLTNESIVANLTTENTNIDTVNDPYALESLKNGARSNGNKYATAGLELHNWTGAGMTPLSPDVSFSQPLVNRSGKCDSTKNSNYPCVGVWQDASYTNNTVIDTADSSNTKYNYGPGSYEIGTYYNYCAASAGTYCYGNGTSAGTTVSGDATSDICPAGWHMPSDNGGTNGDYLALCSAIKGSACTGDAWNTMVATDSASLQYQLSTPLSGDYNYGTAYRQGTYGVFWSTTYYSGPNMWFLVVNSSGVHPQDDSGRRTNGKSVRCVSS